MKQAAVVVLNMYSTGLGIARNVAEYGIPVIGISSHLDAPGNCSRYCHSLFGPDSQDEPEALLDCLISVAKRQDQRAILFPTRDVDVMFIDKYRSTLESFFAIAQPSHDVLDSIMDKDRLARTARSFGISTPITVRIGSLEEAKRLHDEFVFPAVVKPVYAHQWRLPQIWEAVGQRKGIKVEGFAELLAVCRKMSGHQVEFLVQEWVHGDEDQFFVVGAYLNGHSECLGAFTAQKILQFPPDFGLGCLVRSVDNEEVRSLGIRLLERLRCTGIAEVEFKMDSRSGAYRLIEINPRHWDQHSLGAACGVNLTYLAYCDLCGSPGGLPSMTPQTGFTWVSGSGIIGNLKEDLRKKKLNPSLMGYCFPSTRKVYALWDWRDPLPFLKAMVYGFMGN